MNLSGEDIITSGGKYPDRAKEATDAIRLNAQSLAEKVQRLLTSFGRQLPISSGFRTVKANADAGGAPSSWHLSGHAVDLLDHDGDFSTYCLCEQDLLGHFGLWLEDPRWTRGQKQKDGTWAVRWVHLQDKPPSSGRRTFRLPGPEPR